MNDTLFATLNDWVDRTIAIVSPRPTCRPAAAAGRAQTRWMS
ncbi:hypothetical protein ACLFLT_15505 [Klebsiella pneumoniae]